MTIWGTWYTISVFLAPEIASSIDKLIWKPGLSESIRGGKSTFDALITDIPNAQEFKSGAVDIGEKITDGIDTTKETIDQVRSGAQKVEETYNQAKDTYDSVKESLSGATQTLKDINDTVNSVSNSFSGTLQK